MNCTLPAAAFIQRLEQRDLLEVVQRTAKQHRVTVADIVGRSRTGAIVAARHAVWLELYETTAMSYPEIGILFDRDHSTVMAGVKKIRDLAPETLHFNIRVAV